MLALQDAIRQGKFPAGSQLPPEMELLQMMGISRTTLREALRILEEQRFIRKRREDGFAADWCDNIADGIRFIRQTFNV